MRGSVLNPVQSGRLAISLMILPLSDRIASSGPELIVGDKSYSLLTNEHTKLPPGWIRLGDSTMFNTRARYRVRGWIKGREILAAKITELETAANE